MNESSLIRMSSVSSVMPALDTSTSIGPFTFSTQLAPGAGYAVTVKDAGNQPGGMMRYGIPQYRLPREVLDVEIDRILRMGVTRPRCRDLRAQRLPEFDLGPVGI